MNEIINVNSVYSLQPALRPDTPPAANLSTSVDRQSIEDVAEFSRLGRMLARATMESSYRIARLRAIRTEIENGTYETPERIEGTVARLLDVLG